MEIRRFVEEDLQAVGRVHALSRRSAYASIVSPEALAGITPESQAAYWADRLGCPPPQFALYVGEVDDEVVGFVLGSADESGATLNAIHLLPKWYGGRRGQDLHDRILQDFGTWGCPTADLWVLRGNERAQSFYRRNGWVADGSTQPLPMGTDTVVGLRYLRGLTDPS